jgi:DNA-binding beta-propeller fold protein YncE
MIFNTDTWEAVTPIELGAGHNPMNMVIYNENLLYVACLISNSVLQVNRSTGMVSKSIAAGFGTTGIASAEGKIYASNTNAVFDGVGVVYKPGSVTVIDGATGDSLKSIPVGYNPQVIDVAPDGRLHVLCTGNYADVFAKVIILDPTTDQIVDSVAIGGSPGGMDISAPNEMGYLTNWGFGVLSYSTENYSIINGTDDYLLGKGGSGLVSDQNGNIFVSVWEDNQVIELNNQGDIVATYDVGLNPQALALRDK